uniref:CD151 antigen-like n=1 Tax=Saccoglossus kowalevskii TaxID=10224 RepID=A0ABM0MV79_SACKO|nr:PREDICTED: CD151 antigen-like [Saccoglossus kowalevskii]
MEDYGNVKYVTDAWNEAQLIFECCGVYGYEDYQETSWFESSPLAYPVTCCKIVNYKSATPVDPEKCYEMENVDWAGKYMNTRGCINQFQSWVHDNVYILGGVSIGVACLQLFGMIFAICLCRNIGDDD